MSCCSKTSTLLVSVARRWTQQHSRTWRLTKIEDDRPERRHERERITLAGLLDAIDTARHDGVLLIMTSNQPDTLDAALVRAGRIDKNVYFGRATKAVIGRNFECIYKDLERPDFERLASAFVSAIADEKLTAAEIQGYLFAHSTSESALENAASWIEAERSSQEQPDSF
jgi:SpoVK/Ycf46/Vps4 family AAA+-type ATPase